MPRFSTGIYCITSCYIINSDTRHPALLFTGTYEVTDGTNYITMNIGETFYKGVMISMQDEAGNNTFCISAVGDNNHSIWGIHYTE